MQASLSRVKEEIQNRDRLMPKICLILLISSVAGVRISVALTSRMGYEINPDDMVWRKMNGPDGGKIIDVAIDPKYSNILYTAVYPISSGLLDGGIYKTIDGGVRWQRKIDGIEDKETWSISMDPNNSEILWAGTNSGQIYKTNDAGEIWVLKKNASGTIENPLSDTIYTVEIDPFNSMCIMAGSRHGNLFRSEDAGETWETIHKEKGLNVTGVISDITYDPENQGTVYLTSGFFDVWDFIGNGIYKSIDGGETWKRLENGLEGKTQFGDLVIDPSNSSVIYAANGMEDNPSMGVIGEDLAYLYRSENAGETWERIDIGNKVGEEFTLNAVAIHPEDSNRIYVLGQDQRVVISEDRGETWQLLKHTGIIGIGTFVEYDPNNYTVMYATTYAAGIFKSTDAGITWHNINGKEISFAYVEGLLADPVKEGTIYSQSFENGFHYSEDFGETWERGDVSGNYWVWTTFIEKPLNGSNIYVVGRGGGNMKRTTRPNGTWELLYIPETDGIRPWVNILESSDNDKDLLYAGTRNCGIFRTKDGCDSWEEINTGLPRNLDVRTIIIDPNDENRVYAGSINNKGRIWFSDNGGDSWSLLNDEMTFTTIHAMEVDPSDENTVYAAPWGAGLFKSTDGGDNWTEITGEEEDSEIVFSLAAVKVHPENSSILYAADRADSILLRSDDGGNTWRSPWCPGEKEYFRLNAFTFDPENPEIYYVSAWKMGSGFQVMGDLFRHNEDGSWENITNGLPRAVLDVEVDPLNSNVLYASTHVYGVFKSTDNGSSWEEIDSFPRIGVFDLAFNDGALYAATSCGELPEYLLGEMPQVEGDCGLYKSTDGGDSWVNLLPEELRSSPVKEVTFKDDVLYIATNNDSYVSSDEVNWHSLDVPFKETSSIKVTDNKIYVATHGGGVYQKEIAGSTWYSYGPYTNLSNVQLSVDPADSDTLYASSFPGGVFKSTDRGETWNEKNFALPSFRVGNPDKEAYYSFVINPRDSENLFLGLFGKGVYVSLDGADTWMPMNKGLDNKEVYNIQLDASGDFLYAGTNGGSVYKVQLCARIESCGLTAEQKDLFDLGETIYVAGTGYSPSTVYDFYIVADEEMWTDGMAIPERVPDTATTVSSNPDGGINPTAVWDNPQTIGNYDIVVDVNSNGEYDVGVDPLDDSDVKVTAGFFIPEFPPILILPVLVITTLSAILLKKRRLS